MTYGNDSIIKYHTVEYLGCHHDSNLSGRPFDNESFLKSQCKT